MSQVLSPTQEKTDRLLAYLAKKIGEHRPHNVIFFIVDILCTYYPQHIPSFSKIWLMDKALDEQKQHVCELFRRNNSTSGIAQHFINAGFDSLDALTTLNTDVLDEIQAYNDTTWLPGHKVKVNQIFKDIKKLVKEYKDELKAKRVVWNYTDAPLYQQADGTYVTTKTISNINMDAATTTSTGHSIYYYPKYQTSTALGTTRVQHPSSISPVITKKTVQTHGDVRYAHSVKSSSPIGDIIANALNAHIQDGVLTKSNMDPSEVSVVLGSDYCFTDNKN